MGDNYFNIRPKEPNVLAMAEEELNPDGFMQRMRKAIKEQLDEDATAIATQKTKEFEQEMLAKKDIAVLGLMRAIRIEVNDHSIDGRTINIKIHYKE